MKIRGVKDKDLSAICGFARNADELFLFSPASEYPLTEKKLRTILGHRHASSVVEQQGEIIGFANLYKVKKGDTCFIGNVVIRHDQRSKGLGARLVKYMMDVAVNNYRVNEVHISVFEENPAAIRLYERLGFVAYDSKIRANYRAEERVLIHMRKIV